jgi:hypothetical protein
VDPLKKSRRPVAVPGAPPNHRRGSSAVRPASARFALFAKTFTAFLLFFALAASAEPPKTVDVVLSDYTRAVGGLPAVDAVNTRRITASAGLLGKAQLYWQKPNKVVLVTSKGKTGYDGGSGWFYSKKKHLIRLSQGQQMPLEIDGNPLRYVHMKQLYSEIDAAPQKTVDDTLMDVLVAPNDLAQTVFYFDAHTHLLARLEEKGETSAYFTQTVWFEDYQTVDGVQFPFRITHKTSDKGGTSEEFRVKQIEDNISMNPDIFSKPQSTNLVFGGKR